MRKIKFLSDIKVSNNSSNLTTFAARWREELYNQGTRRKNKGREAFKEANREVRKRMSKVDNVLDLNQTGRKAAEDLAEQKNKSASLMRRKMRETEMKMLDDVGNPKSAFNPDYVQKGGRQTRQEKIKWLVEQNKQRLESGLPSKKERAIMRQDNLSKPTNIKSVPNLFDDNVTLRQQPTPLRKKDIPFTRETTTPQIQPLPKTPLRVKPTPTPAPAIKIDMEEPLQSIKPKSGIGLKTKLGLAALGTGLVGAAGYGAYRLNKARKERADKGKDRANYKPRGQ